MSYFLRSVNIFISMKGFIKKLLRESLLMEFNETDFTPEDREQIMQASKSEYDHLIKYAKERFDKAKANNEYKNSSIIDNIMNSDNYNDKEKESLIKTLNDIVKNNEDEYKKAKEYYDRLISDKDNIMTQIYQRQLVSAGGEGYRIYMNKQRQAAKDKSLSKEDIINLFVGALEGGSNYWYEIKHIPRDVKYAIEHGASTSESVINYILSGGKIYFYDIENESEDEDDAYLGYVDMGKLLDGISILKRDYPNVYENIIMETYDAGDADVFLQLCVMGDVVYG